jgi:hypothetical protein
MARNQRYTEDEVLKRLSVKRDVSINPHTRTIQVLNGNSKKFPKANDLGNGSWGKIDFLCNHREYHWIFVDEFTK